MARLGAARLYTPEEAQDLLAAPVLFILMGKAEVHFPDSSVAAPSGFVHVSRKGKAFGLRYLPRFPVTVQWKQWDVAVVPVLQDPRFDVRSPLNRRAIDDGNLRDLINKIGLALKQSFEAAGYGAA